MQKDIISNVLSKKPLKSEKENALESIKEENEDSDLNLNELNV